MAGVTPQPGPISQYNNAKDYLDKNCIPQMFRGLISGLMVQRPPDHYEYMDVKLEYIKEVGVGNVNWESFVYDLHPKRDPVHLQYVHDEHYDKEMRRRELAGQPPPSAPASQQQQQQPMEGEEHSEKEESEEEEEEEFEAEYDLNTNINANAADVTEQPDCSAADIIQKPEDVAEAELEPASNIVEQEDEVPVAVESKQVQVDAAEAPIEEVYKPEVFQLTEPQDEDEDDIDDSEGGDYNAEADDEDDEA